mmetsp:Transcript_11496/g.34141  ORF Transcript_11496/g.34141 Transcript_11496/m.34141 type:complete len:395 (+) Transcript_11496:3-1187(+)
MHPPVRPASAAEDGAQDQEGSALTRGFTDIAADFPTLGDSTARASTTVDGREGVELVGAPHADMEAASGAPAQASNNVLWQEEQGAHEEQEGHGETFRVAVSEDPTISAAALEAGRSNSSAPPEARSPLSARESPLPEADAGEARPAGEREAHHNLPSSPVDDKSFVRRLSRQASSRLSAFLPTERTTATVEAYFVYVLSWFIGAFVLSIVICVRDVVPAARDCRVREVEAARYTYLGGGWVEVGESQYRFSNDVRDPVWPIPRWAAQAACAREGATLVHVNSYSEEQILRNLIGPAMEGGVWIGLNLTNPLRGADPASWSWEQGAPGSDIGRESSEPYLGWSPTEPSVELRGIMFMNVDRWPCAVLDGSGWRRNACEMDEHYVCERRRLRTTV